ncbi:MAG: PD-(D/E)XK nuclease family protein [Cyanobacteria bacterium P01_H01_bin.26]
MLAMAVLLSATKLKSYAQCPRAYYFRYEYGLKKPSVFGAAVLGRALHGALAQLYQDWPYQEPLPSEEWLRYCWETQIGSLAAAQVKEGWQVLRRYFETEIVPSGAMTRPLATEGRIQGLLQVKGLEFRLTGRYDRLDSLEDGLELIDYKSAKNPVLPTVETVDLQLGLYSLALEQRYGKLLRQMSLLFLRTGERVTYEVTYEHRRQVEAVIGELALRLLDEEDWQPQCGEQCGQCAYARYCSAVEAEPEPLPEVQQKVRKLQLCLGF